MENALVVLYAVRNSDGKFFRAKGYGGGGDTWVDDLQQAKMYGKMAPARRQVSYFAIHYPDFPAPELIELHVTKYMVVGEQETAEVRNDKWY